MSPKSLPPLPSRYRLISSSDGEPETYSFRVGACLLSLGFLAIGLGVLGSFVSTGDYWQLGIGVLFCVVFLISAGASRFWSDRPVEGLRRILAELQFVVVSFIGLLALVYVAIGVGLVMYRVAVREPELGAVFVLVFAVLVFFMWKLGMASLVTTRISTRHFFFVHYIRDLARSGHSDMHR